MRSEKDSQRSFDGIGQLRESERFTTGNGRTGVRFTPPRLLTILNAEGCAEFGVSFPSALGRRRFLPEPSSR